MVPKVVTRDQAKGVAGDWGGAGLMPKRADLAIESEKRSIITQNKRKAGGNKTGETDEFFPWNQEYLVRCRSDQINFSRSLDTGRSVIKTRDT